MLRKLAKYRTETHYNKVLKFLLKIERHVKEKFTVNIFMKTRKNKVLQTANNQNDLGHKSLKISSMPLYHDPCKVFLKG